jgi:hypothetical protein
LINYLKTVTVEKCVVLKFYFIYLFELWFQFVECTGIGSGGHGGAIKLENNNVYYLVYFNLIDVIFFQTNKNVTLTNNVFLYCISLGFYLILILIENFIFIK